MNFEAFSFDTAIRQTTALKPISDPSGMRGLLVLAGMFTVGVAGAVALGSVLTRNRWENNEQLKTAVIEGIKMERVRG